MSNGETGGPYLAAAFLCEKVLQESDGVVSAIRIVDRFVTTAAGTGAPDKMPPFQITGKLVIMFKSGDARGNYTVGITPVTPSGIIGNTLSLPMFLEGEDRGVNVILNLVLPANEEGLYWLNVLLNNELITRIPLRVIYEKVAVGSSGATPIH